MFVKAAEKGALDDELVGEFVKQQQLNEKWKQSTINVEDTRACGGDVDGQELKLSSRLERKERSKNRRKPRYYYFCYYHHHQHHQ